MAKPRTKEETLAWLRKISGELATATLKRLEDTLPWYSEMPPGRRSAVGLVAQAGITSFISWFDDPKSIPWIAADVFGAAPRELLRSVSLQQTLQLIRVTVEVVEERVKDSDELLREAILLYSREIAFAAADVYARTVDGADLHPGLNVAAFAEETVVAASCVLPLPEGVPLTDAALLGCAVLTGYGAVHHSARVRQGETVAVFGVGGVGLATLQAARIAGAPRIIAVDVSPEKEELARGAGATDYVVASENTPREIRALTDPPLSEETAQQGAFDLKSYVLGFAEQRRLLDDVAARKRARSAFDRWLREIVSEPSPA